MTVATEIDTLKILILGSPAAGKSGFVAAISDQCASGEGKWAGWRMGYLAVEDNLNVKFMEPPATDRFEFVLMRDLIEHADVAGFIVLCDSAKPETFNSVVGLLETIRNFHPHTPCILAANKQDVPGAWSANDIGIGLGIPDHILVVPCVARNRNTVKEVVVQLLYRIFE